MSTGKSADGKSRMFAPNFKRAPIHRYVIEDRIRLAVIICPFCEQEHRHVLPVELASDASMIRDAPCKSATTGVLNQYRLAPAEGDVEFILEPYVPKHGLMSDNMLPYSKYSSKGGLQ